LPDFGPILPPKRPWPSLLTTNSRDDLCSARALLPTGRQNVGPALERVMSEVEFDRIVDAVRKEIALAPALHSLTGLRASDWRAKAASDKPTSQRHAPMARIRRVG